MNETSLRELIILNNIEPDAFNILGRAKDFATNLCLEGKIFKVFYMERGMRTYMGEYDCFDDAAEALWMEIKDLAHKD